MILSAFNSIISSNAVTLEEAKSKLSNSISPDFKTQVLSKIPTQDSVKSQLTATLNDVNDLKKLEAKHRYLKNQCSSQIAKVDAKINQIQSIKSKTQSIDDRFSSLDEIIKIANQFLPAIKTIISVAPGALAALGGIGTGLAITKVNDGLKVAKGKVKEFEAIVKALEVIRNKMGGDISPINKKCDAALDILNSLKIQIETLCNYTDQILLQMLTQLPNLNGLDSDSQTNNTGELLGNSLTSNETTTIIENIIGNLENSGRDQFIQYLESIDKPIKTGYRIIKK